MQLFFLPKKEKGMTLVEILVCMLIISTTAAAVIGAFSQAFRFIERAGVKLEAMNIARYAQEKYRAIAIKNPEDSRLAIITDQDISAEIEQNIKDGFTGTYLDGQSYDYPGYIKLTISSWAGAGGRDKQIDVNAELVE